jgi:hypothetical protein
MIQLKRAYEKPDSLEGYRVLVEPFWPRDLAEKDAKLMIPLRQIGCSGQVVSCKKLFRSHEAALLSAEDCTALPVAMHDVLYDQKVRPSAYEDADGYNRGHQTV